MNFEAKKNIIINAIPNEVKENSAFQALWEIFNEKSNFSVVESILRATEYISPQETLRILENMIEQHIFPNKLLCRLCGMLSSNPYQIGGREYGIDNFKEFVSHIASTSFVYELDTLILLAQTLELLFAYGYKALGESILEIYDKLPKENISDEHYNIHRRLVGVYRYNAMNYKALYLMLEETLVYCKASKQKHMYGEIYYYFAVLNVLSGGANLYDLTLYIDKSCQHMYPMATILKNHYNI